MNALRHDSVALIIRVTVGIVFVYASLDKIIDPAGFAKAVNNYHILPNDIISIFALFLPWAELLCGAALILGLATRASAQILTVMTVMFIVAIVSALVRGLNIDCGCFSTSSKARNLGFSTLAADLGLLALAVYVWIVGAGRWTFVRHSSSS